MSSSAGYPADPLSSTPYLPSALPEGWSEGLSYAEYDKMRNFLGQHATSDGLQANLASAALAALEGLEDCLHIFGPAVWRPVLL